MKLKRGAENLLKLKKLRDDDLKKYNKVFSNLRTSGIIVMHKPGNF